MSVGWIPCGEVLGHKLRIVLFNVAASLADDFDIADHAILHEIHVEESKLVKVLGMAHDTINRLHDMAQVIGQALLVLCHTGTARANTSARNDSGNALGVTQTRRTPSKNAKIAD